jgi:hypothetical protein
MAGQAKDSGRREPWQPAPRCRRAMAASKKLFHDFKQLTSARTSRTWAARLRFARACHMISGPPRSVAALAPTCSTLRRQLAPR